MIAMSTWSRGCIPHRLYNQNPVVYRLAVELNVKIDASLPPITPDAVNFETGASRTDLERPDAWVYEHHGETFTGNDRGSLPALYEDLILGRAMPPTFHATAIHDIDTVIAAALFLHRDLLLSSATANLVSTADFVHRLGPAGLAHAPVEDARFLTKLRQLTSPEKVTKRELGQRVTAGVDLVCDYLHNPAPTVPNELRILTTEPHGFVVATTSRDLWDGWVELFRLGYLHGVLLAQSDLDDRRKFLIARKSNYIELSLAGACEKLNAAEVSLGELPSWQLTSNWLHHHEGSLLTLRHILAALR